MSKGVMSYEEGSDEALQMTHHIPTQSRWRSKQHNEIVSLRPVSLAVMETATAAEKADLLTAGTARSATACRDAAYSSSLLHHFTNYV